MADNKPTSKELSIKAKEFLRENKMFFWDYLMPILPALIVTDAAVNIGAYWSKGFGVLSILSAYLTSCFVLAWHRAVLLGPKREHAVHPFSLKKGEGKFIATFFLVAIAPVAMMFCAGVPVGIAAALHSPVFIAITALVASVVFVFAIVTALSIVFVLPAKSVNVDISFREARQIAKGLLWRFFAASVRANIWLGLLMGLLSLIVAGTLFATGQASINEAHQVEFTLMGVIVMFVFSGIPALLVNFIIVARGVAILSFLYQWSVQNRSVGVAR